MAKINNLFYLSQYKRQKKNHNKPKTPQHIYSKTRKKCMPLNCHDCRARITKCSEPPRCHFPHLHFFIAISRLGVNLPTEHCFHDSTRTPDFPAFLIPMWLTHHFLSTSTFKASVLRTLVAYCFGKRKGRARKGLHEMLAPSRQSPRGPFGSEGRSADLTWSASRIPRAPSHISSPPRAQSREALPSSSSALSANGTNPGDQNRACVQAHTHTRHGLACPHTHAHTGRAQLDSARRSALSLTFRQHNTRGARLQTSPGGLTPPCELTTCSSRQHDKRGTSRCKARHKATAAGKHPCPAGDAPRGDPGSLTGSPPAVSTAPHRPALRQPRRLPACLCPLPRDGQVHAASPPPTHSNPGTQGSLVTSLTTPDLRGKCSQGSCA